MEYVVTVSTFLLPDRHDECSEIVEHDHTKALFTVTRWLEATAFEDIPEGYCGEITIEFFNDGEAEYADPIYTATATVSPDGSLHDYDELKEQLRREAQIKKMKAKGATFTVRDVVTRDHTTLEILKGEYAFCPVLEFPSFVVMAVEFYDYTQGKNVWSWVEFIRDAVCRDDLTLTRCEEEKHEYSGQAISAWMETPLP